MDPSQYRSPSRCAWTARSTRSRRTCTNSGAINLPTPPTAPMTQLNVWGWDRIDAVQATYPAGGEARRA